MIPELICQVCEKNKAIGVSSSGLAPMSRAICVKCLQNNAEMLWLVHATIEIVGGPDQVVPWVKTLRSFRDGKYIAWEEIVKLYTPKLPEDWRTGG